MVSTRLSRAPKPGWLCRPLTISPRSAKREGSIVERYVVRKTVQLGGELHWSQLSATAVAGAR